MDYFLHILIMINIYIILTVSSNLLIGVSNLLTFGQAAFYGIGAYITAWALLGLQLTLLPTLLFALIFTSVISLVIGYVILKMEGDYFILGTLAFQMIVYTVLYNWIEITRGPYGIPGIPAPKLFGIVEIYGIYSFAFLSLILALITCYIFYRLIYSPFGRALKGFRDDKISLMVLGRNTTVLKIQAFVLASSFAAISGFIYASYISFIDPTSFNLDEAFFILSAVLIGGTGNIKGPVIGAVFVILLPEGLRFVGMPDTVAANMRMIIYGLTLILLMYLRPQGIAGNYSFK